MATLQLPDPSREQLIYSLYEAAELEHNLMCTYLYAAFSLRSGPDEGLSPEETAAVAGWRQELMRVAIEEMGHLAAVWNITSALGGSPRFGRDNFPLSPGLLPAGIVVKLAPFNEAVLQHFVHLERPHDSGESEGQGFAPEFAFERGSHVTRLTPTPLDYDTVGAFYQTLDANLRTFVARHGEAVVFCGDPLLQLSSAEIEIDGAKPVICSKTALAAFTAIVEQGEGAPAHSSNSHFVRFKQIRDQLARCKARNPEFAPAHPAATNPVLRRPLRSDRVWLEGEAAATVDVANAGYALMLRLLAHSYTLARPAPDKGLVIDLAMGLMRAMTALGERAARMPAGPSNPHCNAGMSFTNLRDASALPPGPSARRFFLERLDELRIGTALLDPSDARVKRAAAMLDALHRRASIGFASASSRPPATVAAPSPNAPAAPPPASAAPVPEVIAGVEHVPGSKLNLLFEAKRCIHARFCVTGAPRVFLANVQGPWIHPDAIAVDRLVEIAHACPSGAIRYERKDDQPNESAPPVNLLSTREAGPYAVRGELRLDGAPAGYRATLCRCGASKNKPYCDGSHHEVGFSATGEPPSGKTDMLDVRDGVLAIDPELDGPLQLRGNLEITSGTGRVVARVQHARLCRCGASNSKPFCDGSHVRVGFKST